MGRSGERQWLKIIIHDDFKPGSFFCKKTPPKAVETAASMPPGRDRGEQRTNNMSQIAKLLFSIFSLLFIICSLLPDPYFPLPPRPTIAAFGVGSRNSSVGVTAGIPVVVGAGILGLKITVKRRVSQLSVCANGNAGDLA